MTQPRLVRTIRWLLALQVLVFFVYWVYGLQTFSCSYGDNCIQSVEDRVAFAGRIWLVVEIVLASVWGFVMALWAWRTFHDHAPAVDSR